MSHKPAQPSVEHAGADFGAKMARRLFESRTKPGRATQAELHLNQEDLANMLAVAFEAGARYDPAMTAFSFRAECLVDVQRLHGTLNSNGIYHSTKETKILEAGLSDVGVEICSIASLKTLRAVFAKVVDGHVMLETLRQVPLLENSLERETVAAEPAAARSRRAS